MSTYGWGLKLVAPNKDEICFFEKHAIVNGDPRGEPYLSCIDLMENGKFGHLITDFGFEWIINFENKTIAPYRASIYHSKNGEHLTHFEQPSYQNARSYVREGSKLLYITFPFFDDRQLAQEWVNYVELRKSQLDVAYFENYNF